MSSESDNSGVGSSSEYDFYDSKDVEMRDVAVTPKKVNKIEVKPRLEEEEPPQNEKKSEIHRVMPTQSPYMNDEMWHKMKEKELIPIQLHFEDLTFSVPPEKGFLPFGKKDTEWKTILKGLSGTFQPGSVTAIMGASGAGKTTLLDVLAGRAKGKIGGKILYNGLPPEEAKPLLKQRAYVMQADILLASQTPREILDFAANLRLPKSFTPEQRTKRVEELITELNINYCQHTQVGSPGLKRGVSGGERKRVAIGTEMITNPSIMFLDEPTSGLDSETAENVMEILRNLARHGRTVVCTIHQPNSHIWAKFDQLMLLAKGKLVYDGPASQAVEYFNRVGFPCPEFTNPPDFFLNLLHVEQSDPKSSEKIDKLIECWDNSKNKEAVKNVELLKYEVDLEKEKKEAEEKVSVWTQTRLLLKRSISDNKRNPMKTRSVMGQTIFLSLVIGLTYLRLGSDQSDIQSKSGALFFIVLNQAMSAQFQVVSTFFEEKAVLLREVKNNMYPASSYYFAKFLADLPLQIISPFVFTTITYWLVGFDDSFSTYIIVLADVLILSNAGSALGLCLSVIAPTMSVAIAVNPAIFIPFVIFSGFLINRDTVPPYFIWCDFISFVRYGFQIAFVTVFEGKTFECKDSERLPNGECPIATGDQLIENYYFDDISVSASFFILLGMWAAYRLLAFVILVTRVKKSAGNV